MPRSSSPRLTHTAESLGAALGKVAARLDAWKQQRATLAADIAALAKAAETVLHGSNGDGSADRPAPTSKGGRPKGYKMSDEARAKLRAAWQRRKAMKAPGHEHTKPGDGRAVIRAKEGRKFTARQRGRG